MSIFVRPTALAVNMEGAVYLDFITEARMGQHRTEDEQ